ncbi:hypothetical protein [Jannaschia aquimarina]|uniref:hypothetical protein n=1 Tax=Jannaschia aquimarina TaxID=935700 RepID=UPI000AF579FA|nr:hypothetical protein [Jannaschia aquimarina]
MAEFATSLGVFGWIVIGLAVVGLATLPRALREMWTRPWKREGRDRSVKEDRG